LRIGLARRNPTPAACEELGAPRAKRILCWTFPQPKRQNKTRPTDSTEAIDRHRVDPNVPMENRPAP
jgi:hypothetical protein